MAKPGQSTPQAGGNGSGLSTTCGPDRSCCQLRLHPAGQGPDLRASRIEAFPRACRSHGRCNSTWSWYCIDTIWGDRGHRRLPEGGNMRHVRQTIVVTGMAVLALTGCERNDLGRYCVGGQPVRNIEKPDLAGGQPSVTVLNIQAPECTDRLCLQQGPVKYHPAQLENPLRPCDRTWCEPPFECDGTPAHPNPQPSSCASPAAPDPPHLTICRCAAADSGRFGPNRRAGRSDPRTVGFRRGGFPRPRRGSCPGDS